LSGGTDKICRLWNPKKGKLIQEYKGHSYDIFDIQIVYDNSAFASCGGGNHYKDSFTPQTKKHLFGMSAKLKVFVPLENTHLYFKLKIKFFSK
jgi:WD40 repeat protein